MAAKTTHGMTKTRVYEIWVSMRKRCHSPGGKTFQNYGTRGIFVCERWRNSLKLSMQTWAIRQMACLLSA